MSWVYLFGFFFFPGTARNSPDESGPANAYTGSTSNYYVHTGKVSVGDTSGKAFQGEGRKDAQEMLFIAVS